MKRDLPFVLIALTLCCHSPQVAAEQTVKGKLKAVDAGKNSITINDVALGLTRKTKITVDGKKGTIADIKAGQQAYVTYDDSLEAAINIAIGEENKDQVFIVHGQRFELHAFEMNGIPQNNLLKAALVKKMHEEYKK